MDVYVPKWFEPYELLPPEVFKFDMIMSDEAREVAFNNFFDYKLLVVIDEIREILQSPLIVNNWMKDGARKYSGYRPTTCKVGVEKSMHKPQEDGRARAVDMISPIYSAEEMRQIIEREKHRISFPIRIEKDVSWLHVDVKARTGHKNQDKIYYFKG